MEDKLFDLMTKMYSEIQDMKSTMATKEDLESTKQELKQDIVKIEHHMLDKISALFDAREVQIDRDTELYTSIKQVQNRVDKIDLHIIRNTMKEG